MEAARWRFRSREASAFPWLRYDVSFMPALISTLPTEENTLAGAVLEAPSNAKGW